jgi:hypothetical protein
MAGCSIVQDDPISCHFGTSFGQRHHHHKSTRSLAECEDVQDLAPFLSCRSAFSAGAGTFVTSFEAPRFRGTLGPL